MQETHNSIALANSNHSADEIFIVSAQLHAKILYLLRKTLKDKNHILKNHTYRQVSNISRTLVCNKIVDYSDVVGASPVGAAPTASSFST